MSSATDYFCHINTRVEHAKHARRTLVLRSLARSWNEHILVLNCRFKYLHLLGHGSVLQAMFSSAAPKPCCRQVRPTLLGVGAVHVLVLVKIPPPQVDVQADQ